MEFAGLYRTLGAEVTVLEAMDRVLPTLDRELSQSLSMLMKKRGVKLCTGARLERVERGENILMDMGFRDFRLRLRAGGLLQLRQEDMAAAQARWPELQRRLGADFPHLTIDHIPRPGREN